MLAPSLSETILERLQRLHPRVIDLSLGRIERLLSALGRPQRRLPPVVHIAGTNGKGSTLAMLDAMARAAGLSVHRYISPHLVSFDERILIDGRPIEEARLIDVLERAERANSGAEITFFEITTAAAFLAFAETPADLLLLETGLGGRLDATNVVDRPRLTALSPISMDHEGFLGDTVDRIAFEKAGILKPEVPCVVGPQPYEALAVILRRARDIGAPLRLHGRDFETWEHDGRLHVRHPAGTLDLPRPALPGVHQIANAALAVALALELGEHGLDETAIAEGLIGAEWPARLQRLEDGPLVRLLPEGVELWLDGGHNPAAGVALGQSLRAMPPRSLDLVVAMLGNKDMQGFLRPLAPLARRLVGVPVPGAHDEHPPESVAAAALELGLEAHTAPDVAAALKLLAARNGAPARILICGSLYLAGDVLRRQA